MSVPKQRQTKGRSRRRRSQHKKTALGLAVCPQCQKAIRPHHACQFCGYYDKRQALSIKAKKSRLAKKDKK